MACGFPNTSDHIVALTRAFGPLPYRTSAHDAHLLRAMAATEPAGGLYERLAELVEKHRVIEIFTES